MAKHVCPVCETVHAEKGSLELEVINQVTHYECWECPSCGYKFMAVSDVQELLDKLMGSDAPKLTTHIRTHSTSLG
jgi:hypothetical protein